MSVLKFDPNRKKKPLKALIKPGTARPILEVAKVVSGILPPGSETAREMKLLAMADLIHSLGITFSAQARLKQREQLKDFSLEELWQIVNDSTEQGWRLKPTYYHALMDEIEYRRRHTPQETK